VTAQTTRIGNELPFNAGLVICAEMTRCFQCCIAVNA